MFAKDPRTSQPVPWNPTAQRWIDGSVDNDLPMSRLNEMFNVNHFIVSQVNPHVVPFLKSSNGVFPEVSSVDSYDLSASIDSSASEKTRTIATGVIGNLLAKSTAFGDSLINLAVSETMHRLLLSSEMGIFPNLCTKLRSVLSQKYSGDITILPEVYVSELRRVLKNPTSEFLQDAKLRGQRATWSRISIIRNHCAVELALDSAIIELRSRTIMSSIAFGARKFRLPFSQEYHKANSGRRRRSYDADGSETQNYCASERSSSSTKIGSRVKINSPVTEREISPQSSSHEKNNGAEEEEEEEETYESAMDVDDEGDGDDGGYMMGVYPEDTDFDVGSPIETARIAETSSASLFPTATSSVPHTRARSTSLLQQPSPTTTSHSSPSTPRMHRRRTSGDGYYYNYFNYSQPRISSYGYQYKSRQQSYLQASRSQPTTPGHRGVFSRPSSTLNMQAGILHQSGQQPHHQMQHRVSFELIPSTVNLSNNTHSVGSSPHVQMSARLVAPDLAHFQNQIQPYFTGLPPSVDADYVDEHTSLSVVRDTNLPRSQQQQTPTRTPSVSSTESASETEIGRRERYWPLRYAHSSASAARADGRTGG